MREKQLKTWNRKWKLELIEKTNPEWSYLWDEIAKHTGFQIKSGMTMGGVARGLTAELSSLSI